MFQNSYQNGTYFQVLDLKNNQDKLKNLYKISNVMGNNKVFDKELKTFTLEFNSPNSKLQLPRDDKKDLYLIQQFLVFQIYFPPNSPWNIELSLSDHTKTKRRVILSPSAQKIETKPFFVKTPCHCTQGLWNNLSVDLFSYIEAFKGQSFRSLDSIVLTGHFKLRRIFTSGSEPSECGFEQSNENKPIGNFLPKNYYFPPGVPSTCHLASFNLSQENPSDHTQHTVKQVSSRNKSKNPVKATRIEKNQSVKTQKQIKQTRYSSKNRKDFLSNTNGTEVIIRNRKQQQKSQNQLSDGNPSSNFSKYPKSLGKQKKKLTKTQQIPPKPRTSLEGYSVVPRKGKQVKQKVNPWRNNKINEAGYTDSSQIEASKDQRNTNSADTTSMVKTKQFPSRFSDTKNLFDKRSQNYSQNQYVQLSQKFSTLTDGKFFKHESNPNQIEKKDQQDQIEQNIEMETASVHSQKKKEEIVQQEPIKESIMDSLDAFPKQNVEQIARSSLYGFGEQLMRRFMDDVERPYSPPLGQKEMTQEELTERQEDLKQEVELIYDPVLNCYYDHRTHTYYELKN